MVSSHYKFLRTHHARGACNHQCDITKFYKCGVLIFGDDWTGPADKSKRTKRVQGWFRYNMEGSFYYLQHYCSNLSNKPQAESRQQHLALYMDHHIHSVAVMIEVTSRHMECTYFNLDYSRKPAVAKMVTPTKKLHFLKCSWTAASSVKQHKPSLSPKVKNAFQLKSWRESHLLRPGNLILSTLAEKECCDLSNFLRPFARLS